MRFGFIRKGVGLVAAASVTSVALAQTAGTQPPASAAPAAAQPGPAGPALDLPRDVNFVGNAQQQPNVARASAIVNDEIITRSDIDQRLSLEMMTRQLENPPPDQMELLRSFVLRNLIDEALQIQAAKEREITIDRREIDRNYARYAQSLGHTPASFGDYLRTIGSSERAVKRQIEGELSWVQLQRRLPRVSVGDEEIERILTELRAARGTRQYRPFELFMRATPQNAAQVRQRLTEIIQQVRTGSAPFQAYARQYGDSSVAALGGDLGWVRADQLPPEIAAVVQQMPPGAISDPIQLAEGFSVIALADVRQVGLPDPRDAQLSLIQMSITMPPGTTEAVARQRADTLAQATQGMGGCGNAEATAQRLGATVVSADRKAREMPEVLQPVLLQMNVGQATSPFGTPERISVLVLCGRDDPPPVTEPTRDLIEQQKDEERMGRQAQRLLRDLRRDAVVEYR